MGSYEAELITAMRANAKADTDAPGVSLFHPTFPRVDDIYFADAMPDAVSSSLPYLVITISGQTETKAFLKDAVELVVYVHLVAKKTDATLAALYSIQDRVRAHFDRWQGGDLGDWDAGGMVKSSSLTNHTQDHWELIDVYETVVSKSVS